MTPPFLKNFSNTLLKSKPYKFLGLSGCLLIFLIISIICTSILFPFTPKLSTYSEPLLKPSFSHILGTDALGRDVFRHILEATKISYLIAAISVTIGAFIGISIGSLSAMFGNIFGEGLARIGDFIFAFPVLILALLFRQITGSGSLTLIVAIALYNSAIFSRLTLGSARSLWTKDFVSAAKMAGKSNFHIAFQHILPNIINILIIHVTIQCSMALLIEASLSWLGVGIQPPTPSLGRILMDNMTYYWLAPQLVWAPALILVISIILLNITGENLKNRIDPKQQSL